SKLQSLEATVVQIIKVTRSAHGLCEAFDDRIKWLSPVLVKVDSTRSLMLAKSVLEKQAAGEDAQSTQIRDKVLDLALSLNDPSSESLLAVVNDYYSTAKYLDRSIADIHAKLLIPQHNQILVCASTLTAQILLSQ